MSEQIKELLKKDFVKIAFLSRQTDYADKEKISKLCNELLTTHAFCTNFGNRYLDRLKAIIHEEEFEHKCVLCGKVSGENPVICHQCLAEIPVKEEITEERTNEEEHIQEEAAEEELIQEEGTEEEHIQKEITEEELILEEATKEDHIEKETAEELINEEIIVDEIIIHEEIIKDEIIIQEKINNIVPPPIEDIAEIGERDIGEEKTNHTQISSKRLYFLYAVIVILLMIIFKQSIVVGVENDKKNEFSAAQAKKVVEEFYDKTKYKISLQEVSECPKAIFQTSQGKQVPQEAWLSSELVGVYAYSIEGEKENVLGQVWVSFQGEAIQLGMTENKKFIVLKECQK